MKNILGLIILLGILVLGSCYRPTPRQAFSDLKLLDGDWTTYEGSLFNESWEVINDSLLKGVGFSLLGSDTVFSEKLLLKREGDSVYYGAMTGTNNSYAFFKLKEAKYRYWVFQNPDHDYPNIITYEFEDDTLLEAITSNIRGNKKITFKLKRVSK